MVFRFVHRVGGARAGNGIKTFDPRTQVSPDKVHQLTFQYFLPGIHFSVIMNVSVALSQFHGCRSPYRCETFLQVFAQDLDCYKEEEMERHLETPTAIP